LINGQCDPVTERRVELMFQAAVQEEMCDYLLAWFRKTPAEGFPCSMEKDLPGWPTCRVDYRCISGKYTLCTSSTT